MQNVLAKLLLTLTSVWLAAGVYAAAPYATDWIDGHNSRARLIVGGAPGLSGDVQRYVALELALQPGWKTYWRQPGTSGGIPPQLSWQGSVNLKKAAVKFPAPERMVDETGETIGYKKSVVFPVAIEPNDVSKPVVVNLKAFFGVCREICIPAQAAFKVTLGPRNFQQSPPQLIKALSRVPVGADINLKNKPLLKSVNMIDAGAGRHTLVFDVHFPGGTKGADLFVETGDELPLAMSKVVSQPSADTIRYGVSVDGADQWAGLAKSGLIVTMVSKGASSEARVPRP